MMIKHAACLLLSVCMLFPFAACRNDPDEPLTEGASQASGEGMYIEPAQLSEEEQAIAKLLGLGTDYVIYDFVLQEGVQTMEVNTYVLTDGAWEMISGGGQRFEDTTGRLALGYDKIAQGVRIAVQSEKRSDATSYTPEFAQDLSQMAVATATLSPRTEIVFDQEIPLVLQIITSKNEIRSHSTQQFFEPAALAEQGHEYVYAIAVRFSQKTVSELEAK